MSNQEIISLAKELEDDLRNRIDFAISPWKIKPNSEGISKAITEVEMLLASNSGDTSKAELNHWWAYGHVELGLLPLDTLRDSLLANHRELPETKAQDPSLKKLTSYLHAALATGYLEKGKHEDAAKEYEKANSLDSELGVEIYNKLGKTFLGSGLKETYSWLSKTPQGVVAESVSDFVISAPQPLESFEVKTSLKADEKSSTVETLPPESKNDRVQKKRLLIFGTAVMGAGLYYLSDFSGGDLGEGVDLYSPPFSSIDIKPNLLPGISTITSVDTSSLANKFEDVSKRLASLNGNAAQEGTDAATDAATKEVADSAKELPKPDVIDDVDTEVLVKPSSRPSGRSELSAFGNSAPNQDINRVYPVDAIRPGERLGDMGPSAPAPLEVLQGMNSGIPNHLVSPGVQDRPISGVPSYQIDATTPQVFEVVQTSAVMSEPNPQAQIVDELKRGTRVQVIGKHQDWLQLRSLAGRIGFIRRMDVVPIN